VTDESLMWCPVCGAEYQPRLARCADCDVHLVDEQPEQPDGLFRTAGAQLAGELERYERAGGNDPLSVVVQRGDWGHWFRAAASTTGAPRPAGRWEIVLQHGDQRVVVVGLAGGGWRVATPAKGPWIDQEIGIKEKKGADSLLPDLAEGLGGVPRALWIPVLAVLAGTAIWLGIRSGPPELRALAGLTVAFVALVIVCLVPRTMRRLLVRYGAMTFYAGMALVIAYVSIGAAEGLHVGMAWPVNAWRDLFENETVLIDTLSSKRVVHHEHCGNSGCYEEDHYWISVGGEEWPVSQTTHDVLRRGEVVEIAYRPHTRFVEYVAYGPALSSTRGKNELRVAVTLAPAERKLFEDRILPDFKQRTGLDVTFVQMEPDTLLDVLENETASPFDLLAVDNNQVGQLADKDLVQDLSDEVGLIPPEVVPSMRPLTQVDGRTLFLPFRPNVMITYYDQTQLQRLGVTAPQTWQELLDVAAQLDQHGQHLELQGAPGAPSATQLDEFLLQAGGDPLALDSPQSLEALDFLAQLAPHLDGHTAKAKFDTVNDDLTSDTAAVAPNWTFGVSEVVVKQGRRDIAAYPGWAGPAGPAHVLGGDVLAIPKVAERRKPALKLAEYLMSQPVQATLATQLFWPSMRVDAYHDVQPELRPYWDAINNAMANTSPRPAIACWHDVEKVLSKAWKSIVVDRASPGELVQHWSAEIRDHCEAKPPPAPAPVPPSPPTTSPYTVPAIPPFPKSFAPDYITAGPDGNVWFTNDDSNEVGRITPNGEVAVFPDPDGKIKGLEDITAGPDGNLWFTSYKLDPDGRPTASLLGRITPSGEIATFEDRKITEPDGITAGPDGNLWFTNYRTDRIGRITPDGQITLLADPDHEIGGPDNIVVGPDGNLWFTNYDDDTIGRIKPNGDITVFRDPDEKIKGLEDITAGPDGNLWFTSYVLDDNDHPIDSVIGRITPHGKISTFTDPKDRITEPEGITPGYDGDLWLTSYRLDNNDNPTHSLIGRITPDGKITVVETLPDKISGPEDMTAGPDGNLWFTNTGNDTIGRIAPNGEVTTFPVK
jgi:trehalose transport system substrate-binding protein